MPSKWDEPLDEIMGLIHAKTSRAKTLARAKEVKVEISKAWIDAQLAIQFLDSMVNRYLAGPDWPQGFWFPPPQQSPTPQVISQMGVVQLGQKPVSLVTRPERILEVAKGASVDGTVLTKVIIDQLRAGGDQRPDRALAVSVGNVLTRHGWQRVEPGKYKLVEKQEGKEAK